MRSIAIALIVSSISFTAGNAFAQDAQTWRKVSDAIPLGTRVQVQTLDGKRVKGTLVRVEDASVMVKKNTRMPEPAVTVTFEQMASIERDNGGMGWGKAIGFGAGAGAAAILTIMAIAFQLD